jgi:hypothetical protein
MRGARNQHNRKRVTGTVRDAGEAESVFDEVMKFVHSTLVFAPN